MHMTFDFPQPGLATIDGPAIIDRGLDQEPSSSTSDKNGRGSVFAIGRTSGVAKQGPAFASPGVIPRQKVSGDTRKLPALWLVRCTTAATTCRRLLLHLRASRCDL